MKFPKTAKKTNTGRISDGDRNKNKYGPPRDDGNKNSQKKEV